MKRTHFLPTFAILLLTVALAACSGAVSANQSAAPTAAPVSKITQTTDTNASQQPAAEPVSMPEAIANTKLNLNTASGDEYLSAIPDFPNRMVREFLEYRPYASIQQFRSEIGKYVGDAQVAAWEQYVYVPVQVDQSDAETLKQIPGVDDAIAADLMAGRPYGSNEAFLTVLAARVPNADLAVAASYLSAN
ncbi:MAG: hypothetical protein J5I90_04820 [Caldilineales bacterium]|nr:hypothetical protein [Caldilineales bacterium]